MFLFVVLDIGCRIHVDFSLELVQEDPTRFICSQKSFWGLKIKLHLIVDNR